MLLIKNCIPATQYSNNNADGYEEISIITDFINRRNLKITAIYNPPHRSLINEDLNHPSPTGMDTIIIGDLNSKSVNWDCRSNNNNGESLLPLIIKSSLKVISSTLPTYYPIFNWHRPDILDIAITNYKIPIAADVLNDLSSNHLPVILSVGHQITLQKKTIAKTNWNLFTNILIINNSVILPTNNFRDIDTHVDRTQDIIINAFKEASEEIEQKSNFTILPREIRE